MVTGFIFLWDLYWLCLGLTKVIYSKEEKKPRFIKRLTKSGGLTSFLCYQRGVLSGIIIQFLALHITFTTTPLRADKWNWFFTCSEILSTQPTLSTSNWTVIMTLAKVLGNNVIIGSHGSFLVGYAGWGGQHCQLGLVRWFLIVQAGVSERRCSTSSFSSFH